MSSCDSVSPTTFRAGEVHPEGVTYKTRKALANPSQQWAPARELVWLRSQLNQIFFNQSQLVLYLLLFISYRLFFTGHWHPETLEPRVEAPGHWNLGTLEPRASVCLSRSTPRLISTFSQSRDVVSFYVHTAARATLLTRRGASATSTPLTRRGASALSTPL